MGTNVNTEVLKRQSTAVQGRPSTSQTAWDVADSVSGLACFMASILDLIHDQSEAMVLAETKEARIHADGNMSTLLNCAGRYLNDIRAICEKAQSGGAK